MTRPSQTIAMMPNVTPSRPLRVAAFAAAVVLLSLGACSDSPPAVPADAGAEGMGTCGRQCPSGQYCCNKTLSCEAVKYNCVNLQTCPAGSELVYPAGPYMDSTTCEPLPLQCTCKEGEELKPGMLGRHSALTASQGTLMASGYEGSFGDLVLLSVQTGSLDSPKRELVDGVPDTPPTKPASGWRGGVEDPGDDVGADTDIIMLTGGQPLISYRDITNRRLKVAVRAGGKWTNHVVDEPKGEKEVVGRYASLMLHSGKPAIAYVVLNVAGSDGKFFSELRWATAGSESPAATTDWTVTTIESKQMECRNLCASGQACVVETNGSSCQAKGTGCPACAADQACVAGSCKKILADVKYTDIPRASGLWPSPVSAQGGPVVVYYDRLAGRLKAAAPESNSWKIVTLPGQTNEDVGAFCTAVAEGSTVHVSYQNATTASLSYLQVNPTTLTTSSSEVIDDGMRSDGPHPVGADSALVIDGAGTLRVVYQDAQLADLLTAKRAGTNNWTPKDPSDANLGRQLKSGAKAFGFYSDLVLEGGQAYGSTFFYDSASTSRGGLEFFKLP